MEMNISEAVLLVHNKVYHARYKKNVAYAKLLRQLAEGDVDSFLHQYSLRETAEQFAVRVSLTKHVVKSIVKNLHDAAARADRVRSQRMLEFTNDSEEAEAVMTRQINEFHDGKSVFDWAKEKVRFLNIIDPNSIILTDFDADSNSVYPVIFHSHNVLNLQRGKTGKLEWVLLSESDDSTLFCTKSATFRIKRKGDGSVDGNTVIDVNGTKYIIEEYTHRLGYVPAFFAGYEMAVTSDYYVSFFDAGIELILKTIKANSELDLMMSNLAHPYIVRYEVEGGEEALPNALEETVLRIPSSVSASDIVDPNKLIAFVSPPVEAMQAVDAFIEKMSLRAKEAVFNSDIYTKKDIAQTATGVNLSAQALNDKLYPLCVKIANLSKALVKSIADFSGISDSLYTFDMSYSEDLRLRGVDSIISELAALSSARASADVIEVVTQNLMQTMLDDTPKEYLAYSVRRMLNPLASKPIEERVFAISSSLMPERDKIAYINFDSIFSQILVDIPTFLGLAEAEQKSIFDSYLDVFIAKNIKMSNG